MANGTFPIIEARQELGFTPTTAVRADIDVRTGEGAVGAAVGQGLLGLAKQWELINAKNQLSESNQAASDAEIKFLLGLEGNDDPETYRTEFDKLSAEIDSLAPKNRRAANIYNSQKGNRKIALWLKTQQMAKNKLKSKAQLGDFLLLQKTKDISDPELRDKAVTAYKASVIVNTRLGAYDAKSAEVLLDAVDREVELAEKKKQIAADEALEIKREVDRDTISDAFDSGKIDYALIDNSSLDGKEQETLRVRLNTEVARRAKGEDIITDQSVKGRLEDEAYKIWTGALRKSDFDKMLQAARYPTEGKPTIDDGAYDELKSLGARELKTTQAKGMQEASFYGKGQLVEITSDLSFTELVKSFTKQERKAAQSERQIQLDNWSQYNRSMRVWLSQHTEATESEIYLESRKKMPFYRGRGEEDIAKGLPAEKVDEKPVDLTELSDEELLKRIMK